MRERIIIHIDFDSFFASVEQQHHPYLRNKPIGVTATNGRTCIIASSREAKRLGIKTGSRTFEAFQVCPDLKLVPADFIKYFETSKKFLNICKDYSPFVELFSIDELFMDVTLTAKLFGGVYELVDKIKKRILDEIGEYITVSIGISHNKLLAKLASGFDKPNGLVEIKPDDIKKVYQQAKLTDVCGIGDRIKLRLHKLGIYTLLQLRNIPLHDLISEFGKVEGWFLKNIGWGIDESSVIPYTQAPDVKSVGRNYCLPQNEYNKRKVLQNVYELCEEVGIKLRRLKKKARFLGLSLRGNINLSVHKTLTEYYDTGKDMFKLGFTLFQKEYPFTQILLDPSVYIRQISVWAADLTDSWAVPLSLFDQRARNERLTKAIDAINEKFGGHTIRNGFLLYADKLTTVPNGYMADKYERTKLAKEFLAS